jgi:phage shock protein PspC (stress-responsive transcriptional regulator)
MSATIAESLHQLADLHEQGAINDEEFSRAKERVLNGEPCGHTRCNPTPSVSVLRRSRCDRWLAGVCGGLGKCTGIPTWIWRFSFLSSVLFAGTGVVIYVLLWVCMPEEQC